MPSSEGAKNRSRPGSGAETLRFHEESGRATRGRAVHARALGALVLALALLGLGDSAFGGEDDALATIARCPAAAQLLAEATPASVVIVPEGEAGAEDKGAGFALAARATAPQATRSRVPERRVTARFPHDAAGRIEIGVAGEARRVGLRRAFAGAASGRLASGALVFAGAARGVDAVWLARGPDAEELLVVREGAEAIAYDLDLPRGSTLTAPPGFPGLVEVRDEDGEAWLRMSADAAWDAHGRAVPIAVRVLGARVWIDVPADAARPVVVDPLWSGAGRMAFGRSGHTATLLGTGRVLIAGGRDDDPAKGATAELYDPLTGRFTAAATPMRRARAHHSATLLPTGNVLLDGGLAKEDPALIAEVFKPSAASFYRLDQHALFFRTSPTATLLQNGRVLLAGGTKRADSAELYDPDPTAVAPFKALRSGSIRVRSRHTATPLADGRVLLAGGNDSPTTTEIFDPHGPNSFVAGSDLLAAHRGHTATLLRAGRVLIAGGGSDGGGKFPGADDTAAAELFDPSGALPSTPLKMVTARAEHTATLLASGRVLLVGGTGPAGASAEIFDPADSSFATMPLSIGRYGGHTATLLPSGNVMIAGGFGAAVGAHAIPDVEVFDPHADTYLLLKNTMRRPRAHHTATRLLSGQVLLVGGTAGEGKKDSPIAAEIYDPAEDDFTDTTAADRGPINRLVNRDDHTATLLASGEVLIAGGTGLQDPDKPLASTLLYDPEEHAFGHELRMLVPRTHHTATLLRSGQVLITGGLDADKNPTALCELYVPARELVLSVLGRIIRRRVDAMFRFTTSPMTTARSDHTATLLPSGQVLIVGGKATRADAAAVGGNAAEEDLGTAELYDPLTEELHATGALVGPRPPVGSSTATLLPSGEVLIIGSGTPELYDPAAGEFRVNVDGKPQAVAPERSNHTATLLPSGRVLIEGGVATNPKELVLPVLYSPATGEMTKVEVDEGTRFFATATLLASGEVLIAGGNKDPNNKLAKSRRWSEAPDAAFRPAITSAPASVRADRSVKILGDWGADGPDTGGGSTSSSASNHPVAIWMPQAGGAAIGRISDWSLHSATWTAPSGGLVGSGLLFVSAGGSMSAGAPIRVLPGPDCTSNLDCSSGQACSAEGSCGPFIDPGAPPSGCAIGGAPGSGSGSTSTSTVALLCGLALAAIRRGGRAATRARCRAARCSRRRRARRAPAPPRA